MFERFRKERNFKIIEKFRKMGYDILMGEVEKLFLGEMIGRFYIVQVFVKKGYFFIIKEVFEKFLGFGKFVYVKKDKLKF